MDFDMGRYAFYVWGCYGAAVVLVGGLVIMSLRAHARRKAALKALTEAAETP